MPPWGSVPPGGSVPPEGSLPPEGKLPPGGSVAPEDLEERWRGLNGCKESAYSLVDIF